MRDGTRFSTWRRRTRRGVVVTSMCSSAQAFGPHIIRCRERPRSVSSQETVPGTVGVTVRLVHIRGPTRPLATERVRIDGLRSVTGPHGGLTILPVRPGNEPLEWSQMAPELGKRGSYSATYGPPTAPDQGKRESIVGSARTVSVSGAVSWRNVFLPARVPRGPAAWSNLGARPSPAWKLVAEERRMQEGRPHPTAAFQQSPRVAIVVSGLTPCGAR